MSFTGKVCGGVVVLPPGVILPEGADVTVETVAAVPSGNELTRRLLKISEHVGGVPADLAAQHDHYLYGTPKTTGATDLFIEAALGLAKPRPHRPADFALNHGHYVRGEPRKS